MKPKTKKTSVEPQPNLEAAAVFRGLLFRVFFVDHRPGDYVTTVVMAEGMRAALDKVERTFPDRKVTMLTELERSYGDELREVQLLL